MKTSLNLKKNEKNPSVIAKLEDIYRRKEENKERRHKEKMELLRKLIDK